MEFPFNHGHHHSHTTHTHHRRDDDDERPATYPPPGNSFPLFNNPPQPPPPQPPSYGVSQPESHVFHTSHVRSGHVSQDFNYSAPPPPLPSHHQTDHSYGYSSAPAPPDYSPHAASSTVHHVSHQTHGYPAAPTAPDYSSNAANTAVHHVSHESHHTPHFPNTTVHHVSHQVSNNALYGKPTVRVINKAEPNFALTIRHGQVILAPSDPRNEYQHWYKDEKYSTRVKDEEGCPAFSLINKATGEALKHSIGATHPVRLIPYNPDYLDESVLWTESRDLGDGHRAIRMVNNVHLNVDAFHGDKHSGGVHDGTTIVLWEWNKGDNQRWKITPYCKSSIHNINKIPSKSLS